MKTRACVVLAPGFEEIEAVTVIDVLRRAGLDVALAVVGVRGGSLEVVGAHEITVMGTLSIDDVRVDAFDALVLPGGQPGSRRLRDDATVQRLIREFVDASRLVGAVCAAPIALEQAGVLRGRRATAYPGNPLPSATFCEDAVVVDGPLITSRGVGTSLEFALQLVATLVSAEEAATLRQRMLVATGG